MSTVNENDITGEVLKGCVDKALLEKIASYIADLPTDPDKLSDDHLKTLSGYVKILNRYFREDGGEELDPSPENMLNSDLTLDTKGNTNMKHYDKYSCPIWKEEDFTKWFPTGENLAPERYSGHVCLMNAVQKVWPDAPAVIVRYFASASEWEEPSNSFQPDTLVDIVITMRNHFRSDPQNAEIARNIEENWKRVTGQDFNKIASYHPKYLDDLLDIVEKLMDEEEDTYRDVEKSKVIGENCNAFMTMVKLIECDKSEMGFLLGSTVSFKRL